MLWLGEGVSKNSQEAFVWFRKAADQGHVLSRLSLADLYVLGEGVPQDFIEAHKWFNIAAGNAVLHSLRVRAASGRDEVARQMTRDQIGTAQQRASAWRPTPSPQANR